MKKIVVCRALDGTTQEVDAGDLVFRPSVYGVAVRDGKVLLIPQWEAQFGPGYDFPGGGVGLGETIDEAFRREMKEETGLDVERGEVLLCESDFFIHPLTKKPYHTESEKQYAKKAEWVDIAKIRDLKFYNPIDSVALIEKALRMHNK
ncbi:MAG: MutT/NUDIX family protein [Parcubacteria group bacterium Gr01-1014_17]|nr:MAG: MutT/NUDIX family protein [Parcubacteria group bacterium Gr01-1014_17]